MLNVFARMVNPNTLSTSIDESSFNVKLSKTSFISVSAFVLIVCVLIFARIAPFDRDFNRPKDVVRQFVEAVNQGDFNQASAFWGELDIENIHENTGLTFQEFCNRYIKCDRFQLIDIGKEKTSFVVNFSGTYNGMDRKFNFFLHRVHGRWRMRMERFVLKRSEARAPAKLERDTPTIAPIELCKSQPYG